MKFSDFLIWCFWAYLEPWGFHWELSSQRAFAESCASQPYYVYVYTKYIVWLPMAVDLHWGWWSRDTVNSQQQQNKTTKALHTLNQSSLNTKYTSPSASLQTVVMMRPMNRRWFLSLLFSKNILELEAWFWALKALFQDMPATENWNPVPETWPGDVYRLYSL